MNRPQIEYFPTTEKKLYRDLVDGETFTDPDVDGPLRPLFDADGEMVRFLALRQDGLVRSYDGVAQVDVPRSPETKLLGECKAGDVFTISGDTEVFRKLTPDPFGRPGWGYMRESDSKLVYFDRAIVVTIIGKVVCDG